MKNTLERRTITIEVRASKEDGKPTRLTGHAALFNSFSQDLGGFKEKIAPGAFSRAISEKQDVRALFNHDPNHVLGRTASGTLTLTEDNVGLAFDCLMPDTQSARDLMTLVERGDVNQCSFGFIVTAGSWTESTDEDKASGIFEIRTIEDCDLFDISAVTYPAYTDTDCDVRSVIVSPEATQRATEAQKTKHSNERKQLAIAQARTHLASISL